MSPHVVWRLAWLCVFDNEPTVFVRLEMVVVYCCTLGIIFHSVMGSENLELLVITLHNGNINCCFWLFAYTYSTSATARLVSQLLVILI